MNRDDQIFPSGAANGINYRDWLAAQAMHSIIRNNPLPQLNQLGHAEKQLRATRELAYKYADNIIEESNK